MKKKQSLLISFLIGLALLAGTSPLSRAGELKLGLRISGGMAYFNLGDVNAYIRSRADYYREESRKAGYPLSGDLQSLHLGLDSSAELLLFLTPRLALSLGSGYILASAGKGGGGMTVKETYETIHTTNESRLQAVPVTLGLYYFLPLGAGLRLYAGAGGSFYAAKWTNTHKEDWDYGYSADYQEDNGQGIGFGGSLGIEFNVAPALFVFLEGWGRYAKIGNFKGRAEYTSEVEHFVWSGKLYNWESYEWWTNRWYSCLGTESEKPSASWYRNIRQGFVDLSGFALHAGLRIRF